MPGGDRTGPAGAGPMTGWGAGYCLGAEVPGYVHMGRFGRGGGFGRGLGFGRGGGRGYGYGRGRGWGYGAYVGGAAPWVPVNAPAAPQPLSAKQEVAYLKAQARQAKETLEHIEARISELQGDETPES